MRCYAQKRRTDRGNVCFPGTQLRYRLHHALRSFRRKLKRKQPERPERTVGEGSTFTVELPLRVPLEEQDEEFWSKHGVSRMLLVDDDKNVRESVENYMKDTGVIMETVSSGEEAIERVKREYAEDRFYSAIILDWQMPGMNGLDTARAIRKIIPIDTPVLFLTSYDWTEIETDALDAGMNAHIAKPVNQETLKSTLGWCIRK